MNNLIDVIEPGIEINFKCQKNNQKDLIKFILHFANMTLIELAEVIEENISTLHQVISGLTYLSGRPLLNLSQLFYIFASSCEFED